MSGTQYELNRPVHLGRRDVFFEKAADLFQDCLKCMSVKECIQYIDDILYYLQSAIEHASLAYKAGEVHPSESSFMLFLQLVLHHLHSARAIMECESQLEDNQSPLFQFLAIPSIEPTQNGQPQSEAVKPEVLVNFGERSDEILQDSSHMFMAVKQPLQAMQKEVLDGMEDSEKQRYRLAGDSLREYLAGRKDHRSFISYVQTFYPILDMKY